MSKKKRPSTTPQTNGPLARKVLSKSRGAMLGKVTDLTGWREGKRMADEVDATLKGSEDFSHLDPLHAQFMVVQHQLSAMMDLLIPLPELRKLSLALVEAEDEYTPEGPPMSPLNGSYFFCWGAIDLVTGPKQESFASITLDLYTEFGLDAQYLQLLSALERTRMGLYLHQGRSGERIHLRELVTGEQHEVICPAGYKGHKDEVWLVRLFHWPYDTPGPGYSVVINTPYVILPIGPGDPKAPKLGTALDWMDFFSRTLPAGNQQEQVAAYEELMRHGLSKNYWNEYIFLAYVNYRQDMVLLSGIPDRRESLPVGDLAR